MSDDLSYASAGRTRVSRWMMRAIENLSGRRRLLPIYDRWRNDVAGKSPRMMSQALDMIGTKVDITTPVWPPAVPPDEPLVMVANHPFGIGDGIAVLALAEQLNRPYRILINNDFMRVPELRPYALPIDFSETRAAIETNLKSRAEARRLLRDGVTIVIFPAGGVATAERFLGAAEELPWKTFAARLIQQARASVLPVYIEGQNSALFHFVSRFSLTLRLSLLVSEFRHFIGSTVTIHVGPVVPFGALDHGDDRRALMEELYVRVHRLGSGRAEVPFEKLKPRPAHLRRKYPWERASARGRSGSADGWYHRLLTQFGS